MRIIFSTGSLYTYGTERCFEITAKVGFEGVEVMAALKTAIDPENIMNPRKILPSEYQ